MMARAARSLLIAAALGALLLGGCTPRIDELRVKPNLSFAALQKGKIALMPAAATVRDVSREELRLVDSLMYRAFDEHGHGLPRVPFPVVARALQSDIAHWDTLHRAINFGKVDFGALYRLSKAVGARYIVFTRVTYDEETPPAASFQSWLEKKYEDEDRAHNDAQPHYTVDAACRRRAMAGQALSGETCTTSKLVVFSTLVDADEGELLWDAKHHVQREVGNSRQNPNPSLLAWTLFSELFANLPEPAKK